MREYTAKEMKLLKANPYTFKVSKNKLYFTVEFKEAFWLGYKAGHTPRKLISDLGYDLDMFGQKQIDSITQRIKKEALRGYGFSQGDNRTRRTSAKNIENKALKEAGNEVSIHIWNELKYLRQEVEFLKKIIKIGNAAKAKK